MIGPLEIKIISKLEVFLNKTHSQPPIITLSIHIDRTLLIACRRTFATLCVIK